MRGQRKNKMTARDYAERFVRARQDRQAAAEQAAWVACFIQAHQSKSISSYITLLFRRMTRIWERARARSMWAVNVSKDAFGSVSVRLTTTTKVEAAA